MTATATVRPRRARCALESKNEELARVLAQQQTLAPDARRFLAEFDQRRASILDALGRFAGGPLPTT